MVLRIHLILPQSINNENSFVVYIGVRCMDCVEFVCHLLNINEMCHSSGERESV